MWGLNNHGQLGSNDRLKSSFPFFVLAPPRNHYIDSVTCQHENTAVLLGIVQLIFSLKTADSGEPLLWGDIFPKNSRISSILEHPKTQVSFGYQHGMVLDG